MGLIKLNEEIIDNKKIIDKINDFEDYVERLYISSKVTYDEKYHKDVINKYKGIVEDIKNSSLNVEDKGFMMETLAELFNEHKFLNITIDNEVY